MSRLPIDLSGQRFGRLVAKQIISERTSYGHIQWECVCDCKNVVLVTTASLRSGATGSCGCLQKEAVKAVNFKHGASHSSEYDIWSEIKRRCYNKNFHAYIDYGSRGITMCDEWKESFEAFYRDMGPRPSPKYSIDRRDNNKGYSKDNCRWATRIEQNNNRRNTLYFEFDGEKKALADWCRELNVPYNAVYERIKRGMDFEDALDAAILQVSSERE